MICDAIKAEMSLPQLEKDEDGNYICKKDDSFVCPIGEDYGTCCCCPLGTR